MGNTPKSIPQEKKATNVSNANKKTAELSSKQQDLRGLWSGTTLCYKHIYKVKIDIDSKEGDLYSGKLSFRYNLDGYGARGLEVNMSHAGNNKIHIAQAKKGTIGFAIYREGNKRSRKYDTLYYKQQFLSTTAQLHETEYGGGLVTMFTPSGICGKIYLAKINPTPEMKDYKGYYSSGLFGSTHNWISEAKHALKRARTLKNKYPQMLRTYNPELAFDNALANDEIFNRNYKTKLSDKSDQSINQFLDQVQLSFFYSANESALERLTSDVWPSVRQLKGKKTYSKHGKDILQTKYVLPLSRKTLISNNRRQAQAVVTAKTDFEKLLKEAKEIEDNCADTQPYEQLVQRFVEEYQYLPQSKFISYADALAERGNALKRAKLLVDKHNLTDCIKLPLDSPLSDEITPDDEHFTPGTDEDIEELEKPIIIE